jgi:hypothetical protein
MTLGRKICRWIESLRPGNTVPRGAFRYAVALSGEGAVTSHTSEGRSGEDPESQEDSGDSGYVSDAMNEDVWDSVLEPAEAAEKITFIRLRLSSDAGESVADPYKSPSGPTRHAGNPSHESFIVMQCQTVPVSRTEYLEVLEKARANAVDGLYEFAANKIGEPGWSRLADCWITTDPGDFGAAARAVQDFQASLKRVLIGNPVKRVASMAGFPAPALFGDVASQVSIVVIDGPLNTAEQCLAVAGIIIGTFAGVPVLACASFKYLAHEMVRHAVVEAMKSAINDLYYGAAPQRQSLSMQHSDRFHHLEDGRRVIERTGPAGGAGRYIIRRAAAAPHSRSQEPPPGTTAPRPDPRGRRAAEIENPGRGIQGPGRGF